MKSLIEATERVQLTEETVQAGWKGMQELMYGNRAPSLLAALRTGALTAMQPLEASCVYARMLAPFSETVLPPIDILKELLKSYHGPHQLLPVHFMALQAIDELFLRGVLKDFEYLPSDFEGQKAWRESLVKLIKGMSYKTVSMAALVYMPMQCELVPIDRHHLRRYGFNPDCSLSRNKYLALELRMVADRLEDGYSYLPLGVYTACYWGLQRDGKNCYRNGLTDHRKLSCRWY